ncbi:YeeE/YedE thiosulfate transporter family protein [Rhizobium sp. TH135]|uniref:YeeE/YedE thiosulfate transporter family protein n=1 Tax=Rhizobium sp. TH135 TaxID=2067451 RepID=UPI0032AFF6DE
MDLAKAWNAVAMLVVDQLCSVAIGNPTGRLALADCRLHTLAGLVASLLDHIVADNCAEAEFHVVDRRNILDCAEFDTLMAQLLQDARATLHVARDTIHRHAEKNVDTASLDRPQDVLNARSHLEHRAADSAVVIDASNGPALMCCELACEVDTHSAPCLPTFDPTPASKLAFDAIFVSRWPPVVTDLIVAAIGDAAYLRVALLGVTAELGSLVRTAGLSAGIVPETFVGLDTARGCISAVKTALLSPNCLFVIGLVVARFASALLSGRFEPSWPNARGLLARFTGGVLMGWGGHDRSRLHRRCFALGNSSRGRLGLDIPDLQYSGRRVRLARHPAIWLIVHDLLAYRQPALARCLGFGREYRMF